MSEKIKIALLGNPNSGKSSIFNYLTGAKQKVANWSGVTVEFKEGTIHSNGREIILVDLPGTYSLGAYSMEEKITRDYLIEERPDVVVNVIDSTNLERNLYLTLQLIEMGIKPVVALNMWDEAKAGGLKINTKLFSELLGGVPVVATIGKTGAGVDALLDASAEAFSDNFPYISPKINYQPELLYEIDKLVRTGKLPDIKPYSKFWISLKFFENDPQIFSKISESEYGEELLEMRTVSSDSLTEFLAEDAETLIAEARYGFISGILKESVRRVQNRSNYGVSEKIDKVLTNRFFAFPIFFVFMWLLFQLTFKLGSYPMGWIDSLFSFVASFLDAHMRDSFLKDLLINGVIGGVGGVAVFLPNILILFMGISLMEDTGYMARAAFIMDRIMHKIGLHGKSFIPMIMGMGCSVPAIMAARTLESPIDRIKTILLTPLISCSARLPVYVLFAGALFPKNAGTVIFVFQVVLSFGAFFFMGFLFKKTLFNGKEDIPFVMELPPYRIPTGKSILMHMWYNAKHYIEKMGGVVLLFSVVLWFAGAYPKNEKLEKNYYDTITSASSTVKDLSSRKIVVDSIKSDYESKFMAQTYVGRIGSFIEPLVRPLGFDWKGAVALITGFFAKEVVVSSLGVLYSVDNGDADSPTLRSKIAENFTQLQALAFMLFVMLYTPCIVALVTAVRELQNWKWSVFSVAYQLTFAWISAFIFYQSGRLFGFM